MRVQNAPPLNQVSARWRPKRALFYEGNCSRGASRRAEPTLLSAVMRKATPSAPRMRRQKALMKSPRAFAVLHLPRVQAGVNEPHHAATDSGDDEPPNLGGRTVDARSEPAKEHEIAPRFILLSSAIETQASVS